MVVKVICVLLSICVVVVQNARILAIMPMPSYSHQIVFRPLWKELSLRGHKVTLITTDPMNDHSLTNLTEINLQMSSQDETIMNFIEIIDQPPWYIWIKFFDTQDQLIDAQLNHQKIQKLIHDTKEHFDLIIIEGFFTAHYAFASRFKCPFISVLTLDGSTFMYEEIRNPSHYIVNPDLFLPFQGQLTFTQRLQSVFTAFYLRFLQYHYVIPSQQRIVEKHFGKSYPNIVDIYTNYSAFFFNVNNILQPIRPLLPNVVQIGGGTHITENKPLPYDLQSVLDNSTNGVIYFSLGSNVKSKHIATSTLKSITDAFKDLPYTVLWKFENKNLPNKPDNVVISKWFPQQDVLSHPNVKLFITQGGLQSTEESLNAQVPLLGIPIMGDQKSNVLRLASKGLGVYLDYNSITKESLKAAILEVITNPRYRKAVKMYTELVADQSQTGLERAVWWTEYVIRHKGAYHLRNPALDLPLYQYYYLDIIAFCLSTMLFSVYLVFKSVSFLLRLGNFKLKEKQI